MDNNNDNIVMSRIAFERMQAKDERNDKWRNIIIVLLIVLLVVTNGMWLWYESQYEHVTDDYSVELDTGDGGDANYIGNDGDINYGKDNGTQTDGNEAKD